MKPALSVISALLMLSFASSAALAYSGSECEVNDCSSNAKPAKANSSATKAKAKKEACVGAACEGGSATKTKPATLKEQAKESGKEKLVDKVPSQLRGLF